jgi:hypothetical protein
MGPSDIDIHVSDVSRARDKSSDPADLEEI